MKQKTRFPRIGDVFIACILPLACTNLRYSSFASVKPDKISYRSLNAQACLTARWPNVGVTSSTPVRGLGISAS